MILDGRGERIRTSDPLVPNQVLYQAEPLPELTLGRMLTAERLLADPLVQHRKLPQSVTEAWRTPGIPVLVNCEEVFRAAMLK